jgi:SpoVK/Ycf46/Vps4 family AAA+-type ATPase
MHDFINSNPGLKSRFTHTIHFDDYSADELTQIFVNLAESRNFKIDDKTKSGVHRLFEQLYLRRDKNFGNAREVRKIFDATIERQSQRLVKDISNSSNTEYDIYDIIYDDLPLTQDQNVKSIDQVLNELDEFIGMRSVKNMIRRLAVQSMFMKQRSVHGVGKTQQISLNFILTGNPGTGKTTLARKMGEILQSMEILPSSNVIEVSRATLIGKYMGETPKIVNNMCDKALGGILFIDEAYNLCTDNDNYGQEALDTLMKRMEDDRGKFVVIASGYKDNMDAFMSVNPGLSSRFTHRMHIDDYNEDELLSIFKKMASKDEYVLSQAAELKLMDAICRLVVSKDSQFGNAREMRNLLDKIIQHLSYRVSKMQPSEITEDVFKVIMPEDIYN